MAVEGRKTRDAKLLLALAAGTVVSEAAEQAGVSERTT